MGKHTEKKKDFKLPSKVFEHRESLLTELLKITHLKALYHICISMLMCLLINSAVNDYLTKGRIRLGFHIFTGAFRNIHVAAGIWLLMFSITVLSYYLLGLWYVIRRILNPKSQALLILDRVGLFLLMTYYALLTILSTYVIRMTDQPIGSSLGLLMEQTRLLMKIHAFMRTNIPKILEYKPHSDKPSPMPHVYKFFYFLFAPTLIYRDEYPRTKSVNWRVVFSNFFEVGLTLFYVGFIMEKFFIDPFENWCAKEKDWNVVISQILINSIPGLLLLLCAFYVILHSWLNGFAELMMFGDRWFYSDWWTSNTYARWYKTWNVVVHDWLYNYIYKDVYEVISPGNKHLARFSVFFISALFHEYIISFSLKMFLPVMFVQFFIFGTLFSLIKDFSSLGNIFIWFSLEVGVSIQVSLYTLESFARYNCPVGDASWITYFIPRFITCDCY